MKQAYNAGSLTQCFDATKALLVNKSAPMPIRAGSALVLTCLGQDEGDETHEIPPLHYAQVASIIVQEHRGDEENYLNGVISMLVRRMVQKAMKTWALSDDIFYRAEDLLNENEKAYMRDMKVEWRRLDEVQEILATTLNAFDEVISAIEIEQDPAKLLSPASTSTLSIKPRTPTPPADMVLSTKQTSVSRPSFPAIPASASLKRGTRNAGRAVAGCKSRTHVAKPSEAPTAMQPAKTTTPKKNVTRSSKAVTARAKSTKTTTPKRTTAISKAGEAKKPVRASKKPAGKSKS